MDAAMILARLIHIVGGVFWVGAMMFVAFFLMPAMAEAGPDGAKVMQGLMKRKYVQILPAIAVLVMLSGLFMFYKLSGGFHHDFIETRPGHTYATGGLMAIVAFLLGLMVTRPAMMKSMKLAQSAATATGADRDRMLAESQSLRMRGAKAGRVVTVLLILATIAMAIARYM
jgi:uncharacterized membrane protein